MNPANLWLSSLKITQNRCQHHYQISFECILCEIVPVESRHVLLDLCHYEKSKRQLLEIVPVQHLCVHCWYALVGIVVLWLHDQGWVRIARLELLGFECIWEELLLGTVELRAVVWITVPRHDTKKLFQIPQTCPLLLIYFQHLVYYILRIDPTIRVNNLLILYLHYEIFLWSRSPWHCTMQQLIINDPQWPDITLGWVVLLL